MAEPTFAEYVGRSDSDINLAEAALLIAIDAHPGLDSGHYLHWLRAKGDLARERLRRHVNPLEAMAALNDFLFDELRFRGNTENYYDARNSYLNEVIDRRTGIPITLSLVFIEIGRRAGAQVDGIGLPGHFIVRVHFGDWQTFVDPFNGGALLTRDDCEQLLAQVYRRRVPIRPEHLEPVTNRAFLTRLLTNLQMVYLQNEEWSLALSAIEKILLLQPERRASAEQLRARGLVNYKLGKLGAAEQDWLHYLTLAPQATDAELIRRNIEAVRHALASRN